MGQITGFEEMIIWCGDQLTDKWFSHLKGLKRLRNLYVDHSKSAISSLALGARFRLESRTCDNSEDVLSRPNPKSPFAMVHRNVASRFAILISLGSFIATESPAAEPAWIGSDATRSRITVVDVDGASAKVVLDSPHRYAAPEWTPDGASLIVNGGGKLWRCPPRAARPLRFPPDQHRGSISITRFRPMANRWRSRQDRSGKSPPRGASQRASRRPGEAMSMAGRPTASGSSSRPTGGMGSTFSRSRPMAGPITG